MRTYLSMPEKHKQVTMRSESLLQLTLYLHYCLIALVLSYVGDVYSCWDGISSCHKHKPLVIQSS